MTGKVERTVQREEEMNPSFQPGQGENSPSDLKDEATKGEIRSDRYFEFKDPGLEVWEESFK